jgi:hypothetical protein
MDQDDPPREPDAAPEEPAGTPDPDEQRVLYYLRQFKVLSADEAHPEAWVDMARQATEELPHHAFTWYSRVFALDSAGRIDEAIATCRASYAWGHGKHRVVVAMRYPRRLEPEEFEWVCTQAPVENLEHVTMALLEARCSKWAARCANALLERLKLTPVWRWHPSPRWFGRVVLRLRMDGEPELSRALHERYATWLRAEGLVEVGFTEPKVTLAWRALAALEVLPDDFHPGLRDLLLEMGWAVDKAAARAKYLELRQHDSLGLQLSAAVLCVLAPELARFLGLPSGPVRG